jgi:hypothetical protein
MEGLPFLGRKAQSLACSHGAQQAEKVPGKQAALIHGRLSLFARRQRARQADTVPVKMAAVVHRRLSPNKQVINFLEAKSKYK